MSTKTKRTPQPEAATEAQPDVLATKEQVGHAVHALRNSMNTLLMNAAVLGSEGRNAPESLRPFVERIAKAGRQCSDDLTRLFELIDSGRR